MNKSPTLLLTALAAFALNPMAASAQEAVSQQQESASSRLYDAMQSGVDQEQVLRISTLTVANQIVSTIPEQVRIDNPGIADALAAALQPVMRTYSARLQQEYRPRMVQAIGDVMTEEEANSVADFYYTDLGQRVLLSASNNLTVENTTRDGMADMQVDAASVEQDMNATGQAAIHALSEEDQAEFYRAALTTLGFSKMPAMQQQIAPIRAEMESSPPTAEEAADIQAAVISVLEQFRPQ